MPNAQCPMPNAYAKAQRLMPHASLTISLQQPAVEPQLPPGHSRAASRSTATFTSAPATATTATAATAAATATAVTAAAATAAASATSATSSFVVGRGGTSTASGQDGPSR